MRNLRFHGSTLFKYIVSYILILAISFAGFYIILSVQIRGEYEQTQKQEVAHKVENLAKVLNQSFSNIQTTDYLIRENITIIDARYQQRPYLRYEAVNELKKLATSNPVLQDILYLDIKNRDALAANTTCFYEDGHYYIKTTGGDVQIPDALITSKDYSNCIYVLEGGGKRFTLFLCPNSSSNYRIVYLLNDSHLQLIINTYKVQEIIAVGLICNGSFVFSTDATLTAQTPLPDCQQKVFTSIDADTDLYLLQTSNGQLSVGAFINRSFLWEYLERILHTAYLILALLGGLGFILVFFAVRSTYLPLHELTKRATKTDRIVKDDIYLLGQAFDNSRSENQALTSKVHYYQRMLKTSLIRSEDSTIASQTFDRDIDKIFSEDFQGSILVLILFFENKTWTFDSGAVEPQNRDIAWIPLEDAQDHITLLVSLSDPQLNFLSVAESLQQQYPSKVAYSDQSANPMDIARLYYQAKQVQPYAQKRGICSYDSIRGLVENNKGHPYPYETLDRLSLHLREYDFDGAQIDADTLFRFIDNANASPVFTRCLLLDALTLINTAMSASGVKYEYYNDIFVQTLQLCRDANYQENQRSIASNFKQIITVFSNEAPNLGIQFSQVIRFIDANCLNSDFSLRYLADHFHVSPVYMSSLFAKKYHMGFAEYVWKVRLNAAKTLLETTDSSIDQICAAVGYDIPSSFRRKFKQEVGMSPSEYRKAHTSASE